MKLLRTLTSAFTICVMHLPFLSNIELLEIGINVSRHLKSDHSLVRVTLPSGLRVLHYVYVK